MNNLRHRNSPSQQQQEIIEVMEEYFGSVNGGYPCHTFEVSFVLKWTYVKVYTTDPVKDFHNCRGGLFKLGPKGKVDISQVYDRQDLSPEYLKKMSKQYKLLFTK